MRTLLGLEGPREPPPGTGQGARLHSLGADRSHPPIPVRGLPPGKALGAGLALRYVRSASIHRPPNPFLSRIGGGAGGGSAVLSGGCGWEGRL